jgi:hypothetical protein
MTVVGIEVDGSCDVGEVKYRCCDFQAETALNCKFSKCKRKDSLDKCPSPGSFKMLKCFDFN